MIIKDSLKLSYSMYSTYKRSPLEFYFSYLERAEITNETYKVYGDAGNVVHNAVEEFIKDGTDSFESQWVKYDIDSQSGFNNMKLDKKAYRKMYETACKIVKEIDAYTKESELKIEKTFYNIVCKGFIDLYTESGDIIQIYDWKTNSTHTEEMHKDQRLFYSWLIWKIKNRIPVCKWCYLKHDKIYIDLFTDKNMIAFDTKMQDFLKMIEEKGFDKNKYDGGDWKHPFNNYYDLCKEEMIRREQSKDISIRMNIKGNFVFFEGDLDNRIEQGIDFKTKFDLPNKKFMQQQVRKKGYGFINLQDIGTIHLYNKRFKCFPIGLLKDVLKIITEFGEYYRKKIKLEFIDSRDRKIMNQKMNNTQHLHEDKTLRPYQIESVDKFLKETQGIINIATGGGKTLIAAEVIRQLDAKTLWIIDRRELLTQTKQELEKLLGVEIGVISAGNVDIKDITIATVQTLKSKLSQLQDYLYTINFVIVDEFHKAAAESYQKVFAKLPNTRYRLGMCLDNNTLVNTKNGKILLSNLKINDKVASFNFKDKKIEYKKILNIWNTKKEQYIIKINTPKGIRKIVCSGNHKFFSNGKFKKAKDLNGCETVLFIGDNNAN